MPFNQYQQFVSTNVGCYFVPSSPACGRKSISGRLFLSTRKDYLLNTDSLLQIKLKKKRRLEKREVYAEKNRQIYLCT